MGLEVAFTDRSTPGPSGQIQAWDWDFGDGSAHSTDQDPVHTYSAAGDYDVTLVVTGAGSDGTATVTHTETVTADVLTSAFSAVATGLTVAFADASSPGPSGPVTGWSWDFGDGGTSTSQNPSHTYAAAGTYDVTLTVTGTSPDGTDDFTRSVVAAVPPSGTVYFDGRAALMTALSSTGTPPRPPDGTLVQVQTPELWTALLFENNDLSLAADSRYGQAFKCTVPIGDSNPWNTGAPSENGAGEMTKRRPNNLGNWDYFSIAAKVPSWDDVSAISFATFLSVGYQTSQGDQVGLGLINNGGSLYWQVHQNSGFENYPVTAARPAVSYRAPISGLAVTFGQWREFVLGVKWATDNTGAVEVYSRLPSGSWSKVFEKLNTPTYIYGKTSYGSFAADGSNWPTVLDKIGLYYSLGGVVKTETIYVSGVSRCSDLDTAKAVFPA